MKSQQLQKEKPSNKLIYNEGHFSEPNEVLERMEAAGRKGVRYAT